MRQEKDMEPCLLDALKLHLTRWTQNLAYAATQQEDPMLHAACQKQKKIGWNQFTRGRIADQSIQIQLEFYAQTNEDSAQLRADQ